MTMDGRGPYQIARILKEEQVEIPAVHMAKKDAGLWKGRVDEIKDPYGWGFLHCCRDFEETRVPWSYGEL